MEDIANSPFCDYRPDIYGRGGFVAEFEKEIAELLGKEAAVFMPSGTMAQPIALRIWSDRAGSKRVAFHPTCHLELYEHGAYRELHHLEAELLGDPQRLFTLDDLRQVKGKLSSLLIELPQREIGGQLPTWEELSAITEYAKEHNIRLHLDGARLWECQPYYARSYKEIVAPFDSVYVSFYKILFGLPGAALAGPADFIDDARIWMRRQGGNLVHMFPNAISAKTGLDLRLPRIADYVAKAGEVAAILGEFQAVTVVPRQPPTNMMHLVFDAPVERVFEAAGRIAERDNCLILSRAQSIDSGTKAELWIGDAGIEIPKERLRRLLTDFMQIVSEPEIGA